MKNQTTEAPKKFTDIRRSNFYWFTVTDRKHEELLELRRIVREENKESESPRYVKLHPKNENGSYVYRLSEGVEFDVYVYNYT